jgi:hypothetical protein
MAERRPSSWVTIQRRLLLGIVSRLMQGIQQTSFKPCSLLNGCSDSHYEVGAMFSNLTSVHFFSSVAMFGYLEQKLLGRSRNSLFFLKSNFYVSETCCTLCLCVYYSMNLYRFFEVLWCSMLPQIVRRTDWLYQDWRHHPVPSGNYTKPTSSILRREIKIRVKYRLK